MRGSFLAMTATLGLLGLALVLLGLFAGVSDVAQAVDVSDDLTEITVCPVGPPDCQYDSIQEAVDAAGYGDIIKVATGTYTDIHARNGVTQVVYISETVTIQGGYTTNNWVTPDPLANPTTLDAQGQGRVLYVGNHKSPTIEGLRITGGDAAGLGGGPPWAGDIGGGVLLGDGTNATISDSWVFDNVADSGGGLWARHSEAVLNGNRVFSNTARASGGGLFLELSDDTLSENTVMSNTAGDSGGGLYLMGGAPTLINNVVADNHANGTGSGLAMSEETSLRLLHNTIARNQGGDSSGVAIVDYFGPSVCTVALTNTIMADQSVGINIGGSGISTVTVNAILWHNTPITVSQSPTDVVTVQNQHTGDPAFAADGYHLMAGSAAIDEGTDAGITSDLDGQGRPARAGYDLGADEFWYKIYLPLVLDNN